LIVQLAARLHSYADAAFALTATGLSISTQHVCTLAEQIGTELVTQRNQQAKRGRSKVAVRVAATPAVVAVEVDGGRLPHFSHGDIARGCLLWPKGAAFCGIKDLDTVTVDAAGSFG